MTNESNNRLHPAHQSRCENERTDGTASVPVPVASGQDARYSVNHVGRTVPNPGTNLNAPVMTLLEKPVIQVGPGTLSQALQAAEQCLAGTGRHYQRGGSIVTVRTDPCFKETVILEVNKASLLRDLDSAATWQQLNRRSQEWTEIDPPDRICSGLLGSSEYAHLPALNGLALQPFLRPDGSLCLASGYDAATGLLGVFDRGQFNVPVQPTRAAALDALAVLDELLNEFNFPAPWDRSAALSAMLTASIRPSIGLAPMFHVRAPQSGTGKSYLCELITAFATPLRGTPLGFPGSETECGKLLIAELRRLPAVIEFDNLNGDILSHKALCTALTSENMTGRILGSSRTTAVSTRTLILSSGNNVGPVADMTRRCITINLEPGCELPAGRTFARPSLMYEVRANRGRFVSAALTVIGAWIAAGAPRTPCKPLGSFADWSAWCQQPLVWLGRADPVTSVYEAMAHDPGRETLGRLLRTLTEQFGTAAIMVKDMIKRSTESTASAADLLEVLQEIADERGGINVKRLGHWISRRAGQVVGGLKFVKSGIIRNAQSWQVVSVVSVVSVQGVPNRRAEERDVPPKVKEVVDDNFLEVVDDQPNFCPGFEGEEQFDKWFTEPLNDESSIDECEDVASMS